ncbi:MAG: prolipoprotein diacylglyceryl transferase [Synergistaceae bacterium]|jgi:phosphatidylglycerol:prolipoprotein diacylglycerol transferase|nr:prolipoprotein diacylglyceryl transferase [Synergistaceae bacterium]
MYPVLFRSVDTYYVIWTAALALALLWTVRRLPLYGVDDDEGRRVIGWGFFGMLVGARAFEYIGNFSVYWREPALLFDLNRGGLAEVGAFCGAFLTTATLCRRNSAVPFIGLCGAGAIPACFAIVLGRWGCFFAGCCVGVPSALPWALHFPYDPEGVTRHPTQLYYSLAAAVTLALLLLVEKRALRLQRSLVAPLGVLLYAVMRFSIDPLRADSGVGFSHYALFAALPIAAWLLSRSPKAR